MHLGAGTANEANAGKKVPNFSDSCVPRVAQKHIDMPKAENIPY